MAEVPSVLHVERLGPAPVSVLAASSWAALDRPLGGDAVLVVGTASDDAVVAGAFDHARPGPRRASGGGPVRVGPGSVWLQLALARPSALVACEPAQLLNRYVRPLLKAITKSGALAHYFGRDWVSAQKRPVAFAGFAHDARSGRALVEAVVAVSTPFADAGRPSFLGHAPVTLAELAGKDPGVAPVADAIVASYASAYARTAEERAPLAPPSLADVAPIPWLATVDEAIGPIGVARAASGALRVGGELMVSRDALASLDEALATIDASDPAAVGSAVDATLGASGVALFGIRTLTSVRDAIVSSSPPLRPEA